MPALTACGRSSRVLTTSSHHDKPGSHMNPKNDCIFAHHARGFEPFLSARLFACILCCCRSTANHQTKLFPSVELCPRQMQASQVLWTSAAGTHHSYSTSIKIMNRSMLVKPNHHQASPVIFITQKPIAATFRINWKLRWYTWALPRPDHFS